MAAWATLDECVTMYLDLSEQSDNKYYKCWQIGFRGMEELGLDFFYRVKSVKLPVNGNYTVNIPEDYINYSKIGVLNARGEVIGIQKNSKLTTYADLNPKRVEKTQDGTLWNVNMLEPYIFSNYWDGYNFTPLYGVPSGAPFLGSFKVDISNNVIVLNETFFYDYIILEYLASLSEEKGGIYNIPLQFKSALVAYIGWQDIVFMPTTRRGALGDKVQRERNYWNQRRLAIARYKPPRMNELYHWNLTNQRLTVKG